MDSDKRREEELAAFGRELHDTERNVLAARAALAAAEDAWIEELKKCSNGFGAVVSADGRLRQISSIEGRVVKTLHEYGLKNIRDCTPPTREEIEVFMREELMKNLARRQMSAEETLAIKAVLRAIPVTDGVSGVLATTEIEWCRGFATELPRAVRGDYVETRDYRKPAPSKE